MDYYAFLGVKNMCLGIILIMKNIFLEKQHIFKPNFDLIPLEIFLEYYYVSDMYNSIIIIRV